MSFSAISFTYHDTTLKFCLYVAQGDMLVVLYLQ